MLAGHSERRTIGGETDSFIAQKLVASLKAGLKVILCVGEERKQRQAGKQNDYVRAQLLAGLTAFCREPAQWQDRYLPHLTIAYEPVWASGTGLVAEINEIDDMHSHIHSILSEQFSALAPADAASSLWWFGKKRKRNFNFRLENVGGALVGGASLSADGFAAIVSCADKVI